MDDANVLKVLRIATFMEAYARVLDNNRLEEWPGFFIETCKYKVTSLDNVEAGYGFGVIYADSRGMLDDRVKSLREANIYEGQQYRHLLGLPFIVDTFDGDFVRTETSFIVMRIMRDGETSTFATGSYHDLLAVARDRIALVERVVVCDSARIDTLMALPL